jgi:hypothetical protein
MSAPIPTCEPTTFRAGDTLAFTRSVQDYSAADGWTINYFFRSSTASAVDFSSTPSNTSHAVNVPAATTAAWLPGIYTGIGVITDGTTKKTIFSGSLTILPDISQVQPGTDQRTQNRKIYDALLSLVECKAKNPLGSSTVEGTIFNWHTWADLLAPLALFQVKVRNEEIADLQSQGKPTGRTIFHQFTRPK